MSELLDLEIFLVAARSGSFTEAAETMRLSVASVSRAVARLETHMDSRLFNRTTRRLKLTPEGELALAEVSAGVERLRNARLLLQEQRHTPAGRLKVLLPNTFCKHYMMPELPAFLERHPKLELDMYIDDFGQDLLAGGYEVAVQFAPAPTNGYISRSLGSVEVVLLASPDYLARNGVPRTIADLDNHRRIQFRGPKGGVPFHWHLRHVDGGPITVHQPNGQIFVNSQLDAIIHATVCGVGIAPSDLRAVERYLRSGELKIVLPDYRLADGGEVVMLYPHRDHVSLKARVFMDFIIDLSRRRLAMPDFDCRAFVV